MLLYRWQGRARNFGDELNPLLWGRLLPGFFDEDPTTLFLGIGSVLDARHAPTALKLVAGAGYGGYERPPVLDARWVIHWVRGPRTAHRFGLGRRLALGDPAMLLPQTGWSGADGTDVGFMPHFESAGRGAWAEAAAAADVMLIDPRGNPGTIIDAIKRCRLLLSEALHGVIVADAFRVPWVALRPIDPVHRAKWHDWADMVGLRVNFRPLAASSLLEWLRASRLATFRRGREALDLASPALARAARRRFIEQAARSLVLAVSAPPQLSGTAALDRCQTRMLERIDAIRRNPLRPA